MAQFSVASLVIGSILLLSSAAPSEVPADVAAFLTADDECGRESSDGVREDACALHALQVRSGAVATLAVAGTPKLLKEGLQDGKVKDMAEAAAVAAEAPKVINEVKSIATAVATAGAAGGAVGAAPEEAPADTFPDPTTGVDVAGPYDEEPDEAEAARPRPAKEGWADNMTDLGAAWGSYGSSFCTSHQTGFFCDGNTRVRCCHQSWGYIKCGSTWHSSTCGYSGGMSYGGSGYGGVYPGGGYGSSTGAYAGGYGSSTGAYAGGYGSSTGAYAGGYGSSTGAYAGGYGSSTGAYAGSGEYHIHSGWRQSDFCTSHHVGSFCYEHNQVQCCNDVGHFVDCTASSSTTRRC